MTGGCGRRLHRARSIVSKCAYNALNRSNGQLRLFRNEVACGVIG